MVDIVATDQGTILSFDGSGFDATRVQAPTIVKVGSQYSMFYGGLTFGDNYQIGLATSSDGVTWTKYSSDPVIGNADSQSWDSFREIPVTAMYEDGIYKLWFNGDNTDLDTDGGRINGFGYATSVDGIHWTQNASNPIRSQPRTQGAGYDLKEVVKLDGQYHAFYVDRSSNTLYQAVSSDGVNFSADSLVDIASGYSLEAATAIKVGGSDLIFAILTADGAHYYGTSTDGINFAISGAVTLASNFSVGDVQVENGQISLFGSVGVGNVNWGYGNDVINYATAPLPANLVNLPAAVSSVSCAPSNAEVGPGGTVTLTVILSEAVAVAGGVPTLALNNGGVATYNTAATSLLGDPTKLVFTYTVGAFGSGQDIADLALAASNAVNPNGATITDGFGTAADLSGANGYNPEGTLKIDTTNPIVTSVSATTPSGTKDVGANTPVAITITLDEAVKVKGAPTLSLNDGGTANYKAGLSNPVAGILVFSYTVKAGQDIPNLEVTSVNLPTGATVKDAAGHSADFANALTTFTGLQIDTTAPTVSAVSTSGTGIDDNGNGDLGVGSTVTLTVNFSEPVTVDTSGGIPILNLNDGGKASYTGGSGTNALIFMYTVAAKQNTSDLAVNGLALNGGRIQDGAGNNAILTGAKANPSGILQIDTKYDLSFNFTQSFGSDGLIIPGSITWTLSQNGQVLDSCSGAATTDDAFPLPNKTDVPIQAVQDNNPILPIKFSFSLQNFFTGTTQKGVLLHSGLPAVFGTQVSQFSQGCVVVPDSLLAQLQADLMTLAVQSGAPNVSNNLGTLVNWVNKNVDTKFTSSDALLSQPTLGVSETPSSDGSFGQTATFQFNISRKIEKEVKVLYSVTDTTTGAITTREAFIDPDQLSSGTISIQSLFSKWSAPSKWSIATPDPAITVPANPDSSAQLINATSYMSTYGAPLPIAPGDSYQISIHGYEVLYGPAQSRPSRDIWYLDSKLQGSTDLSQEQLMFGNNLTASFALSQTLSSTAVTNLSADGASTTAGRASIDTNVTKLVQAMAGFGANISEFDSAVTNRVSIPTAEVILAGSTSGHA